MKEFTPLPRDYATGNGKRELENLNLDYSDQPLWVFVEELMENGQLEMHYATVLDWAAELRRIENLDWVSALKAAEILYFG